VENKLKKVTEDLKKLGNKIGEVDEKLTDHLAMHAEFEIKFNNVAEEMAQQRFDIKELRTDNSRIKHIQERQDEFAKEQKKLILAHEKMDIRMENVDQFIKDAKQRHTDEQAYRIKRGEERKAEGRSNRRWLLGQIIVIGLFILGSLGGGLTWVFNVLSAIRQEQRETRIQDRQEDAAKFELVSKKVEQVNENFIELLKEHKKQK
jgi:hypothetical protein